MRAGHHPVQPQNSGSESTFEVKVNVTGNVVNAKMSYAEGTFRDQSDNSNLKNRIHVQPRRQLEPESGKECTLTAAAAPQEMNKNIGNVLSTTMNLQSTTGVCLSKNLPAASTKRKRLSLIKDFPMPPVESNVTLLPEAESPRIIRHVKPKLSDNSKLVTQCNRIADLDAYEIISLIGEGTYGQVFKAKDTLNGLTVALKKLDIADRKEAYLHCVEREIKILESVHHKNIVNLRKVFYDKVDASTANKDTSIYLVFEYAEHDLTGLLDSGMVSFTEDQNASIMKQLLSGLSYCHQKNILHRDIKCSNILMNSKGEIKLADFGLARLFYPQSNRPYTNKVITLWYRPPELLLGDQHYGPAVDIWSCGCILGQLFLKRPIFQAAEELAQLEAISKICGTPHPTVWPEVIRLPLWRSTSFKKVYERILRKEFDSYMPVSALNLLDKMLKLDPRRRISAVDALNSSWLRRVDPDSVPPPSLPTWQDCHELWSRENKPDCNRDTSVETPK